MTTNNFNQENAAMLCQLDEQHQNLFEFFTKFNSPYFINILLKVVLSHKSHCKGCEEMSEEDLETLTHCDKTLILFNLSVYGLSRLLPYKPGKEIIEEKVKERTGDLEIDSILTVMRILMDLDLREFRHHGSDLLESNSLCNNSLCN